MQDILEILENSISSFSEYKHATGTIKGDAYQDLQKLIIRLRGENYTNSEINFILTEQHKLKLALIEERESLINTPENWKIASLNKRLGLVNQRLKYISQLKKNSVDQILINLIIKEIGIDRFKDLQIVANSVTY